MADVHGNPNITSTLVGSVPTNPDRPLETVYTKFMDMWIPVGNVYADTLDDTYATNPQVQAYLAKQDKKATRKRKK